jgi:uncharacterized protein (DUF1697 family)
MQNPEASTRSGSPLQRLPLRGTATTRNWNTVLKLLEMLTDD